MGKLGDYLVHHSELTEKKILEGNGTFRFEKILYYDKSNILCGDKIVAKNSVDMDVKNYKDYIVSIDDIQFGTKNKELIKIKMMNLYKKIKNIEFSDEYIKKIKIKNERPKDSAGNYIIDKEKGELSFEKKNGEYILKKNYKRKTENLSGAFFSLHMNEETHPHIHCWIPKTVKMGYKYEAFRSAVRKVLHSEGFIMQEDNVFFDKNELEIEKNRKALNNYRTARNVLSAYSYTLEEYQSLKGLKKQDFEDKIFSRDTVKSRRYTISMTAEEHRTEVSKTKKYQTGEKKGQYKEYTVYSFSKLLQDYTGHKAGSQDFINQLISRHNTLTNYSKKDIFEYMALIEKQAIKKYETEGILGITQLIFDCIANKNKVSCVLKFIWRELASSKSPFNRAVAEQITEIYQSRATKQQDIDYSRLEKASAKIKELYNLNEIQEKILERFEELLKTETENEGNIINTLKQEFRLDTLYVDKQDKTVLRFGTKDYEKVSIKQLLGDKATVYQCIYTNKIKNISFKNIDNAELSEVSEIVLKKVIENNLEVILKNENKIDFAIEQIGEQINESKYFLIERFTEGLQEGLEAILECFVAIWNYISTKIFFSKDEIDFLENTVEKIIEEFEFEEKEFSENRSELN